MGDGRFLKVNRGVRTQSPLRWQPSPGSRCAIELMTARPVYLSVCLSPRPGSLQIRGVGGEGEW